MRVAGVIAAALAVSAPAAAFDYGAVYKVVPRPSVITYAKRLVAPDEKASSAAYPRQALAAKVNGAAVILCKASADQRLTDCAVTWEEPGGYGFGDAALSLAPLFKYQPRTIDGRAVASPVHVPIAFNGFPQSASAPVPPPPGLPMTFAERGSRIAAPAELQQIQLMDGRLAAVARNSNGFTLFAGLDDQKRDGDTVEAGLIDMFAYPGASRPVFDVERVRADCSNQTLAHLGYRSFNYLGQPDGWRLSEDVTPRPVVSDELGRRIVSTLCSGPLPDTMAPGIDAALELVKNWPAAAR